MRKILIYRDFLEYNYQTANVWAENLAEKFQHQKEFFTMEKQKSTAENFAQTAEKKDAALIIFELRQNSDIQRYLNLCRALRVPYLFLRPDAKFDVEKISLPVSFLVEDKEKAPFASAFGRFCKSKILIYAPKDYGSKARQNINQMKTLFSSFLLDYEEKQGKKDSFGIEREAVQNAESDLCGMVIISASREYGLDDIIFGSKEKKLLQKTQIPVLLINPRADLYVLCD
ncbi:MAG: hypothetical protein LBB53_04340 [Prevotellaceae bacterium]|jgi:hypothetical protein|nr:hypothetical protein [Prevotellaceae bacterium]